METEGAGGRWLVVVRRDQQRLFSYLEQGFHGLAALDVILDRRAGAGSGGRSGGPLPVDRRRAATARDRSRWRALGYVLIQVPPGS
jgi:hypothetical protein